MKQRHLLVEILVDHFGQAGYHFWQLAHGLDDRPIVPDHKAESISNEDHVRRRQSSSSTTTWQTRASIGHYYWCITGCWLSK